MGEKHVDWRRLSIVPARTGVIDRRSAVHRHESSSESAERTESTLPSVLRSLEDEKCRAILTHLGTPNSASDLCEASDLSRSTVYRKLELLREASLVREYTEVRRDGPNATLYERDFTGISIEIDDDGFELTVDRPDDGPEDRIATFWSEMKEES